MTEIEARAGLRWVLHNGDADSRTVNAIYSYLFGETLNGDAAARDDVVHPTTETLEAMRALSTLVASAATAAPRCRFFRGCQKPSFPGEHGLCAAHYGYGRRLGFELGAP